MANIQCTPPDNDDDEQAGRQAGWVGYYTKHDFYNVNRIVIKT